ncbi:MAG: hypothetical protein RL095_3902 [Verrucomicrobiota bacterium]|jgi:regulator of sirC expression with transglutaminase-like and TPR domain
MTSPSAEALLVLLADPDVETRQLLRQQITQLSIEQQRELYHELTRLESPEAGILDAWRRAQILEASGIELRKLLEEADPDLETLVLLLCRTEDDECDAAAVRQELDGLATQARGFMILNGCEEDPAGALAQFLAVEHGFTGDQEDYHKPANVLLHRVLKSGKGMPITLALLWMLVARRLGLQMEGVGLPGHFVVYTPSDASRRWFDPFAGGREIGEAEVRGIAARHGHSFAPGMLDPLPTRLIVQRLLLNLRNSWIKSGVPGRAEAINKLLSIAGEASIRSPRK